MKLKGIVFDLDGTLVDSLPVTFQAFNHGILSQGGRFHTPEELMSFFGPGEREIFARILGDDRADDAYTACRRYLDENLDAVPLHEGVAQLLDSLDDAGIRMAIFTGRSWNTTEVILRHHGLLDRFVTVVANDHVSAPKPSPEGLQLALQRMGLHVTESLFVGDMEVDIQAARSSGVRGVAALWDERATREMLEMHQPHYWAHHPDEVREICLGQHSVVQS